MPIILEIRIKNKHNAKASMTIIDKILKLTSKIKSIASGVTELKLTESLLHPSKAPPKKRIIAGIKKKQSNKAKVILLTVFFDMLTSIILFCLVQMLKLPFHQSGFWSNTKIRKSIQAFVYQKRHFVLNKLFIGLFEKGIGV